MTLQEKLEGIEARVEVLTEQYLFMKNKLDQGFKEKLMNDIASETGGSLSHDLTWRLRDLFLNTNRLTTIQTPISILGNEEYTDEMKMRKLETFMESLVSSVMGEDTLSYSTSPETNMERRAKYMAHREIYNGLRERVLGK